MPYSIHPVNDISAELMQQLAGHEQFVTHAHNPCMVGILQRTFGWKGNTFIVAENEIPIACISCMFIGGRIVSMPHFSFGGLLTKVNGRSAMYSEILPRLGEYFTGVIPEKVKFLIRDTDRVGAFANANKVISWIGLQGKLLVEAIPANQLSKAQKALQNGLTCKSGGSELLADFYKVYKRNMHRLGSPVLPYRFFQNILNDYKNGEARIFCVYKEHCAVGASFLLSYAGFFENTWFSTLHSFNHLFPAQLLHQEMIRFSIANGANTYSFGRSTSGSGVHEFKRRWKTNETVVLWNYDKPVKMDVRKAEFLSKIWRFIPLPLTDVIGPFIAGRIY